MPTFFVRGAEKEKVERFFAALPEAERPKIVSDSDNPAVWDHPSDDPVVIVTDEPRRDVEAKEITIEGTQPEEVVEQMQPPEEVKSEDLAVVLDDKPKDEPPVKGPLTYRERGFKVGRII